MTSGPEAWLGADAALGAEALLGAESCLEAASRAFPGVKAIFRLMGNGGGEGTVYTPFTGGQPLNLISADRARGPKLPQRLNVFHNPCNSMKPFGALEEFTRNSFSICYPLAFKGRNNNPRPSLDLEVRTYVRNYVRTYGRNYENWFCQTRS